MNNDRNQGRIEYKAKHEKNNNKKTHQLCKGYLNGTFVNMIIFFVTSFIIRFFLMKKCLKVFVKMDELIVP